MSDRSQPVRRWIFRLSAVILPVLAGALILGIAVANRQGPTKRPIEEARRALLVIEVPEVDFVPRALGYGQAQAADVWRAVAEVEGRAVEVNPNLVAGAFVDADEVMLKIDPTEYELAIAQLTADLAQIEAQLAELTAQEQNYSASLVIEKASLELAERELARLEQLAKNRAVSESEIDEQRRSVLLQRQTVQNLENSLNLLPANRAAQRATREAKKAAQEQAKIDLSKTVIRAPFRARIGSVNIEAGQYLSTGEVLFQAIGIDVTEVEAQFPIDHLRRLLIGAERPPEDGITMADVRRVLDFQALVRLKSSDLEVSWEGRVDRIREEIDPRTRAVRLIIAVDAPYSDIQPGQKPPLTPGMFCEVELRGRPRTGEVVVPRSAVEAEHVYIVNSDRRLERRPIDVKYYQGGLVCVGTGIQPGETLVVGDPTPAVEGMLVEPILDAPAAQALVDEATAVGALR